MNESLIDRQVASAAEQEVTQTQSGDHAKKRSPEPAGVLTPCEFDTERRLQYGFKNSSAKQKYQKGHGKNCNNKNDPEYKSRCDKVQHGDECYVRKMHEFNVQVCLPELQ